MNKEATIELLKERGALTIDMAEAFVRGEPEIIYSDEHAVYIIHGCKMPMLYADTKEAAKKALNSAEDFHRCVIHGKAAHEAFSECRSYAPDAPCIQYCRLNRKSYPKSAVCSIHTLTKNDLPFVMEHYHRADNSNYILWRINEGEMQGAYIDDKLVGFIGSHSDGSIGMLEVIPEYRRRGIATALEYFQMNRHIAMGYTPYGQVYADNTESILLQQHTGLDVSQEYVSWAFEKD